MAISPWQTPPRILVVDAEPAVTDAIATVLRYEGYDVEEAATGREALALAARRRPELVVCAWSLPDVPGAELGRQLRTIGLEPALLFLTGDGAGDRVLALQAGASDVVAKPFSLAEVTARIQSVLRRTNGVLPGDVLSFADVTLDDPRHEVFRGGTRIELTATEFNLLRFFLLNPRQVLSRTQILQGVWQADRADRQNVVETYVSYLRRKLDAAGPPLIRTVRQVGYILDADHT